MPITEHVGRQNLLALRSDISLGNASAPKDFRSNILQLYPMPHGPPNAPMCKTGRSKYERCLPRMCHIRRCRRTA